MLDTFTDYLVARGLASKTVSDYVREVDNAGAWMREHHTNLRDATPTLVCEYAETRPRTPSARGHLRSALRYFWEWQQVDGWPDAVDVPKAAPMECKALEPDEAIRYLEAARGWWRAGSAVVVGLTMGLRNEGIRMMRWDGFDASMEWYTLVEKNSRQRTVPVHPLAANELAGRRNGSVYVFEGRFGGAVSHMTINNWVKEVAEAAGFPPERMWPHRMRHTFAAEGLDNTQDLDAVAALMGHVRTETTRGYTRTTRQRLRRVVDSLYQ